MTLSGLSKSGRYLAANAVLVQEAKQRIQTLGFTARAKELRQMTAIQFRFVIHAMPV